MKKIRRFMSCFMLVTTVLFLNSYKVAAKEGVLHVTVPAGSTTKEIQKALDRAKSIGKEGYQSLQVTLTPGCYQLTDGLMVYSDTTLIAYDCTLVKNHTLGPMLRNYLYDKEKGRNYAHDIAVIGGIWNGGAEFHKQTGDETFRFIHAKGLVVKELTIKNIVAGHLLTLAGVENAIVERCTFADYMRYGSGKEALHLDLVHSDQMVPVVKSSKHRIVYDDAPCRNIKVRECTFRNVPSGVGSHSSVRGVYQEDIEIVNNTFLNIETAAIRCYNYKDTTIADNRIEQTGIGIHIYTCTSTSEINDDRKTSYHIPLKGTKTVPIPKDNDYHIRIINNRITTVYDRKEKKNGNGIYIFGSEKRPIAHLIICGNEIHNTKSNGIRLKYAPNAVIKKNTVTTSDSGRYKGGIELIHSDEAVLTENTIKNEGS